MGTVFKKIDGVTKSANWVESGLNKEAIEYAEEFGRELARTLSTSQIRNVFGEVRRIQMKGQDATFESELILLKPKLAYARARKGTTGNEGARDIEKVLGAAIDAVFAGDPKSKYQRFENFANFFEAILAYHRSFGGK